MAKSQIAVRVPPSVLDKLNIYADSTGTTKTEVIVNALIQYLDGVEDMRLCHRVAVLEAKVKELERMVSKN
jgi:predicted DNA-binding protein